ncbi:hypothetical protein HHK36_025549 [Tetracentron sinense]|uniref:Auxin-responsive protein n=1 Tax=Tetracentron sinense TaxID=13715 RepID=A0A834YLD2_TETSI|nr:hypothetical protein HHK36_025549 [Tetracentron sinense]
MEGCSRKEWIVRRDEERFGASEEKKLELRLGPPGEDWFIKEKNKSNGRERDESLLSLGCFSSMASKTHNSININNTSSEKPVGTIFSSPWSSGSLPSPSSSAFQQQQPKPSFLGFPLIPKSSHVMSKESSQTCTTKVVDLQNSEKKACSSASASLSPSTTAPNTSQKRIAPASVVGWPPIRSSRKNLASSSASKPAPEPQKLVPNEVSNIKPESCNKGLFVKINMDGIPIGRKVDLKAYDSYEKLSFAVDELFRDLLAAQRDSSADGNQNKIEETKVIMGLMDGSGEYTLVYEDNEGDRMLVGDVPWHMFMFTVRRLRVLKTSELSALHLGSSKQRKTPLNSAVK